MRSTYRTLNGCEMQHNAEVGLFTRPSIIHIHDNTVDEDNENPNHSV